MKYIVLSIASLILSTVAFAQESVSLNMAGKFSYPHQVALRDYPNAAACAKDKGHWDTGLCFFADADTVEITAKADGHYAISIEKVGTNAHSCEFEGDATVQDGVQLVSSQAVTVYNYDYKTNTGTSVAAQCIVTVSFTDPATLSVITNGNCQSSCGAGMGLDMDTASRK